ncbi:hypothetical protein CR513_12894, partial [Mucuna pruriens]
MKGFNQFINNMEVKDPPMVDRKYTLYKANGLAHSRFLMSSARVCNVYLQGKTEDPKTQAIKQRKILVI